MSLFLFLVSLLPILSSYQLSFVQGKSHKSHSHAKRGKALILVDGFTDYISGYARDYCKEHDIEVIDAVSPYLANAFASQGNPLPEHFLAPSNAETAQEWLTRHAFPADTQLTCLSESDCGVETADYLATLLKCKPKKDNAKVMETQNKFIINEKAQRAGLPTVRQTLAQSWGEVCHFLNELWLSKTTYRAILKPYRGVASDGVWLVRDMAEARQAFEALHYKPQYGGGVNHMVLVQEYAEGPEYAVDTVSLNGEIKVIAMWKYHKVTLSGAPFVYQCTELIPCAEEGESREICNYCKAVLAAQPIHQGPTHTEVRMTTQGPRLMEINPRWHAQNVVDLTRLCLGHDAVVDSLLASFEPEIFRTLPSEPPEQLRSQGRILHLISIQSGLIKAIHHVDSIEALPSVRLLHLSYEVGEVLPRTVDIRTDGGYIVLQHDDPAVLQADYDRLLMLQHEIYEIEVAEQPTEQTSPLQEGQSSAESPHSLTSSSVTAIIQSSRQGVLMRIVRLFLIRSVTLSGAMALGALLLALLAPLGKTWLLA